MSMDHLQRVAPDAYWRLVDMANERHPHGHPLEGQRVYSNRSVMREATRIIQSINERQAIKNRAAVTV